MWMVRRAQQSLRVSCEDCAVRKRTVCNIQEYVSMLLLVQCDYLLERELSLIAVPTWASVLARADIQDNVYVQQGLVLHKWPEHVNVGAADISSRQHVPVCLCWNPTLARL